MLNRVVASVVFSALVPASVLAANNGPIREIRLSSGGLAEIIRAMPVGQDHQVRLDVPRDQVDDILKSLVVNSVTASATGFSLVGPQPLKESFKGLPFTADALASVPTLLTAMQGAAVTVESNSKTVRGKVLGVESRKGPDAQQMFLLSVLTPAGAVDTLELAQDASVTVDDAPLRDKLIEATNAIARAKNDRSRVITLNVKGDTDNSVNVSYVVAAPIWKTTYKVVAQEDGKARLQAWTVLENASGEDWKNVRLVLTSADPVTLRQRLHQLYWKDRQEIPVTTASTVISQVDTGNLANRASEKRRMATLDQAEVVTEDAPAPIDEIQSLSAARYGGAPMEGPAQAAASESEMSSTFALPGTYDLANGDTLSVPIVDIEVPASMVSLYRAGAASPHPVAALMLKNTGDVSLPQGLLTIYDAKSGYVGDAQLAGLPNGDTRLASFASDRKVTITTDQKPTATIVDIKAVDGMLQLTHKSRLVTTYTISGALDGERTVVIEHPVHSGWTFSSPESDGRTVDHYRLKTTVPAGGEKTVQAVDERLEHSAYALSDTAPDELLGWATSGTDQPWSDKLKALAQARQQQVDAQTALENLDADFERLANEQQRIRDNLAAVPAKSTLSTRYLKQLETTENDLRTLEEKRTTLQDQVNTLDEQAQQLLRAF